GLCGTRSRGGTGKRRGGTTIIAQGTTLQGDLMLEGNLHIDGKGEGNIEAEGDGSVGAAGSFEGTVRAHRIVVSGFTRGRVECESLEIVEKGRVFGEVSSRAFIIEPGGQFVGESRSSDEEAVKALGHYRREQPSANESVVDLRPDVGASEPELGGDDVVPQSFRGEDVAVEERETGDEVPIHADAGPEAQLDGVEQEMPRPERRWS
ncbi:MAG: polymer-forming cytoskeletal protein, partial [Ectothiorhodospiraceae bacterium]|nr:polymer-forming cytoskeletal protein [Ectothiorhodospiraceae bacterium]